MSNLHHSTNNQAGIGTGDEVPVNSGLTRRERALARMASTRRTLPGALIKCNQDTPQIFGIDNNVAGIIGVMKERGGRIPFCNPQQVIQLLLTHCKSREAAAYSFVEPRYIPTALVCLSKPIMEIQYKICDHSNGNSIRPVYILHCGDVCKPEEYLRVQKSLSRKPVVGWYMERLDKRKGANFRKLALMPPVGSEPDVCGYITPITYLSKKVDAEKANVSIFAIDLEDSEFYLIISPFNDIELSYTQSEEELIRRGWSALKNSVLN